LRDELTRAPSEVTVALEELREFAGGIRPSVLTNGGLAPALHGLARRSAIPVELELSIAGRFAACIEVSAYYVVSELLTNAVKHASASVVRVAVEEWPGTLHLSILDDWVGGADPARGSGLIGLQDRAEAIGGNIAVASPIRAGTAVSVSLPLDQPAADGAASFTRARTQGLIA